MMYVRRELMNLEKETLTLEKLICRISEYKQQKPNNSAKSIGTTFETSNKLYFFDTGTGKVLEMDRGMQKFLFALLFKDSSVSDLEQMAKDNELDIDSIIKYIDEEDLLKGIEGTQLYDDYYLDKAKSEIGSKCQQLILELTGACNLRCRYCIYSAEEKSFREFNSESISEEVICKSIDYLRDHGESTVYISFYGGEPLVRFDLMKYAIEYARAQITDKKVFFGFTTNLTLMTEEIASYLVNVPNLNMICSIDGPEEIHDSSRVYMDGGGTYKDAMRGYNILKKAINDAENCNMNVNFNAVYMVPYDKSKLYKIDDNFRELCKITPHSTYNITYPTNGTIPKELEEYEVNDSSMWEWIKSMAIESEDLAALKNKGVIDALSTVHQRLLTKQASLRMPMNGCCIPGSRRLYVDTKGDLYVCERINKSPKIGNILTGFDLETIFTKYFIEYSERSIKHCANCWAAKMCPFCYASRMDLDGIAKNAHAFCEYFKEHLKEQFSLYYEILEKDPKKLEILNEIVSA